MADISKAGIRVVTVDPGTTNLGFAIIELTHVTSTFDPHAKPLTRTIIPHVNVLVGEVWSLNGERIGEVDQFVDDDYVLPKLASYFTTLKRESMPTWRRAIVENIMRHCHLILESYHSHMTGKLELPIAVNENQLDGAGRPKRRL